VTRSELVPELGREQRGASWPDEGVVALALSEFTHVDRVCLLTKDTAWNKAGLRDIIMNEVRPAILRLSPPRLGLLMLAQKPSLNDLATYALAVERRLSHEGVAPGVEWAELP